MIGWKQFRWVSVLLVGSFFTVSAYGQEGATGFGTIGDPIPTQGGHPKGAGCVIGFSSPEWPDGEGPGFPCAIDCNKPTPFKVTPKEACEIMGQNEHGTYDYDPETDDLYGPGFGPPGSATCEVMTGNDDPNGSPQNGSKWYPNGHPRCGSLVGEPHVSTMDGIRYDLQAAGEFVAARSLDDDFEIQVRLERWYPHLSVTTAAAARVNGHRVTITARSESHLRVDGRFVEMPEESHVRLAGGGRVIRTNHRYSVVWPDGTNLHVDIIGSYVSTFVLPAEARDGRLTGILGDADGDGANDFKTRDGRALASPPAFEPLYQEFAESWRVTADESLFDYEEGESTATFHDRSMPQVEMTMNDIDPAARRRAEDLCRAAGVVEPGSLEDCIFDVGMTGDETFIEAAQERQTPDDLMEDVTLFAPEEGLAAHALTVRIAGPAERGYRLGFAPKGSERDGRAENPYSAKTLAGGGELLDLVIPTTPGEYELRYRPAREGGIELRQPFVSVAPEMAIEAPATVTAGGDIDVSVTGEIGEHMIITIVPAGSADSEYGRSRALKQGSADGGIISRLPEEPGDYEIRVTSNWGSGKQVYARRPLTLE